TPLAVVVWLGHPQPPEPRQAGGNHAEGASPRGPRLLPPPGDERGQRGAQCEAAADQEHGLRLPQPRALQDRDLLPLRRPRSLPGYPLKTRKSLVFLEEPTHVERRSNPGPDSTSAVESEEHAGVQ